MSSTKRPKVKMIIELMLEVSILFANLSYLLMTFGETLLKNSVIHLMTTPVRIRVKIISN
jgi:hypothetical protein